MIKKGNSKRIINDNTSEALTCWVAIQLIESGKIKEAIEYLSKVKSDLETEAAETRRTRRFNLKSFYNWRWQHND